MGRTGRQIIPTATPTDKTVIAGKMEGRRDRRYSILSKRCRAWRNRVDYKRAGVKEANHLLFNSLVIYQKYFAM
jgi:hypothetical protein